MFVQAKRYAKRMHPKKSQGWRNQRYWGRLNLERNDHWVFGDKQTGQYLLKFSWFHIQRHTLVKGAASPDDWGRDQWNGLEISWHTLVKGAASPDDPELHSYWESRSNQKSRNLIPSYQKLAQKQGFKCLQCGESLFNDEPLQKHHKIPRSQGGSESYANLELLHFYCHQQIHSVGSHTSEDEVFVPNCHQPHLHSVERQEQSEVEGFCLW